MTILGRPMSEKTDGARALHHEGRTGSSNTSQVTVCSGSPIGPFARGQ